MPIDDFNLPDTARWDDDYTPMLERVPALKLKNSGIAEAETQCAAVDRDRDLIRHALNWPPASAKMTARRRCRTRRLS